MNKTPTLPSLMIVDDDPLIREGLALALGQDFTVHMAESRSTAIALLRKLGTPPQLALVDLGLPPLPNRPDEGFHLISELLAHSASIKIFTLSGQDELSNARHARALGAIDFIAKPCAPEKIRQYLNEALSIQNTELSNAEQQGQLLGIVGQSPPIQTLRSQIIMYATMPFPVLIEGESGSGKELIAIALQQLGGNPSAPFKTLNCAAISPTLIESALFGHAKGSFTGAASAQSGFFEEASEGILFLDEIGELSLELQTKLLRVLENGEYQRVGETTTRHSRARIIAATNRNLRGAVKNGTFRADLYHRLNVFSITAPPLRDMSDDKILLLDHFRTYYAQQLKLKPFELDAQATLLWKQYGFPGNTRELRNIIIRLTTKYSGAMVNPAQLHDEFDPILSHEPISGSASIKQQLQAGNFDLDAVLREQEDLYIKTAMELATGNISEAAKLLGMNRTTLHSRMEAQAKTRT